MANLKRPINGAAGTREYGDANATLAPAQNLKADVPTSESSYNV